MSMSNQLSITQMAVAALSNLAHHAETGPILIKGEAQEACIPVIF